VDARFAAKLLADAGSLPAAWQISADELLAASQVLRERGESFDRGSLAVGDPVPPSGRLGAVELMLRGMAVECLLKALWLEQGNALVDSGHYLGVPGAGSHDLPQLASVAAFTLRVHEKDLLRRLSHFIEYGGRYPVPRDSSKLMLTRTPGGGRVAATTWSTPSDNELFDALVLRLEALLE
jgi:hypothetical protein